MAAEAKTGSVVFSVSMSPEQKKRIDARKIHGCPSRSALIVNELESWWSALELGMHFVRQVLTRNEAMLVLDAMNGVHTGLDFVDADKDVVWRWSQSMLLYEVSDNISLNHADYNFEVDGKALVEKLSGLGHLERLALVDWSITLWQRLPDNPEEKGKVWEKELDRFLPNPE